MPRIPAGSRAQPTPLRMILPAHACRANTVRTTFPLTRGMFRARVMLFRCAQISAATRGLFETLRGISLVAQNFGGPRAPSDFARASFQFMRADFHFLRALLEKPRVEKEKTGVWNLSRQQGIGSGSARSLLRPIRKAL